MSVALISLISLTTLIRPIWLPVWWWIPSRPIGIWYLRLLLCKLFFPLQLKCKLIVSVNNWLRLCLLHRMGRFGIVELELIVAKLGFKHRIKCFPYNFGILSISNISDKRKYAILMIIQHGKVIITEKYSEMAGFDGLVNLRDSSHCALITL